MKRRKTLVGAVIASSLIAIAGAAGAAETSKLGAPSGAAGDLFGWSVAHDGPRVVVGAPSVDTGGLTRDVGSAYLFDASTGALVREVVPAVPGERINGDSYGRSVAVAGGIIAIGSPGADDVGGSAGEVFVFDAATGAERANLVPITTRRDPAGGAAFGSDVDASPDRIVVGAPGTITRAGGGVGAVYLYAADTLRLITRIIPRNAALADNVGHSVAVGDGTVVAGAPWDDDRAQDAGAAYVFDASDGRQRVVLTAGDAEASDLFGFAVATDGGLVAIAAPFDDDLGSSSGSVYLFDAATGAFVHKFVPDDGEAGDQFGIAVDLVGDNLAVGAWGDDGGAGSVYVFEVTSGRQLGKLTASDAAALDILGRSVALSGSGIVAGAPNDDDRGTDSGSVYRFGLPTP